MREYVRVRDVGVQRVAENCSQLQKLVVSSFTGVTSASVEEIAKHSPHLQAFQVAFCKEVAKKSLLFVVEHCS